MLARVFAGQASGFYIDVGAWDPDRDSVTRHFYGLGWSGINVEPTPEAFERLAAARPRDVNLRLALGEAPGEQTLFERPESGLSSLVPPRGGEPAARSRTVAVDTLAALCARHAADRSIDFLKIDVEGWEEAVIRGADWARFRPRVVLVEATEPNTPTPAWDGWEPLLLAADYRFVYFDGLNRFYVRGEEAGLGRFFATPPNVFDRFLRADAAAAQAEADRRLEALNAEYEKLRALVREREAEIAAAAAAQAAAQDELAGLRHERAALEALARGREEEFQALRREYEALTRLAAGQEARHAAFAAEHEALARGREEAFQALRREYEALTRLCREAQQDAERLRRSPAMRYFAWVNSLGAIKS